MVALEKLVTMESILVAASGDLGPEIHQKEQAAA
jgi:hypothetical protein